jgi:hypothetical protein
MLTIENIERLLQKRICDPNGKPEYYVKNIRELKDHYHIILRCMGGWRSDEILILLREKEVGNSQPICNGCYALYDNSNPQNRVYLPTADIRDMINFVGSIQFLMQKDLVC